MVSFFKRSRFSAIVLSLMSVTIVILISIAVLQWQTRAEENPPDPEHNGSVVPGAYVYGMSSNSILYYVFADNYDTDKNGTKEKIMKLFVYNRFRYQGNVTTALYEKATNSVFLSSSGTYITISGSVPAIGETVAYLSSTGWAYAKATIYQNNNGVKGSVLKAGTWSTIPAFTIYIPGTVPPPSDTTPPVISNITVTNVTQSSATINWNTNEAANSKLEWGKTTSYAASYTKADGGTTHTMGIPGTQDYTMCSNTTYHYRITATDLAGNVATSADRTFTTTNTPCSSR